MSFLPSLSSHLKQLGHSYGLGTATQRGQDEEVHSVHLKASKNDAPILLCNLQVIQLILLIHFYISS